MSMTEKRGEKNKKEISNDKKKREISNLFLIFRKYQFVYLG